MKENLLVRGALYEKDRLASFYIAPVGRGYITLGYVVSAWMIGSGMSLLTLLLGNLFLMGKGEGLSIKICLILVALSIVIAVAAVLISKKRLVRER